MFLNRHSKLTLITGYLARRKARRTKERQKSHGVPPTNKVLTTGPVTQVPWNEIKPKSVDKHLKTIQKTRNIMKNWSFHGPWPEKGVDLSLIGVVLLAILLALRWAPSQSITPPCVRVQWTKPNRAMELHVRRHAATWGILGL